MNYKLVDEMTEGLTFVNNETYPLTVTVNGSALAAENYNVAETTEPRGFTLTFNNNAEGNASILKTGDVVTVTYYAQINENAKIADEANVNKAKVEYGTNSHPFLLVTLTEETLTSPVELLTMDADAT